MADGFEVEHAAAQLRAEHAMFETFDLGQPVLTDFIEPAQVASERPCFLIDAVPTQVFEQVVVRVHAVHRGVSRMRLVQVSEQVVNKVRKRFGNGHVSLT